MFLDPDLNLLPVKSWKITRNFIKLLGEEQPLVALATTIFNQDLSLFLQNIGLIDKNNSLSQLGIELFRSMFVRMDKEKEIALLKNVLLKYRATLAIQQNLWGLDSASIEQVITVLKSTGLWGRNNKEYLTNFLDLLNFAEIITYDKKRKKIKVIVSPNTEKLPKNIFIDPARPFSNIIWIKKVLSECNGFIYWYDKHFQKQGLEWIAATANATKIRKVRILSLDLGVNNLNEDTKDLYKRLKKELVNKGIDLVWATIDSKLVRDSHDRWIHDSKGNAWNIPNVNAISSGQKSELYASENYEVISKTFQEYWEQSKELEY